MSIFALHRCPAHCNTSVPWWSQAAYGSECCRHQTAAAPDSTAAAAVDAAAVVSGLWTAIPAAPGRKSGWTPDRSGRTTFARCAPHDPCPSTFMPCAEVNLGSCSWVAGQRQQGLATPSTPRHHNPTIDLYLERPSHTARSHGAHTVPQTASANPCIVRGALLPACCPSPCDAHENPSLHPGTE
jgi:hypothetical protein